MDGLVNDTNNDTSYEVITVTPTSPKIGAEVGNIDLTRPLTDAELADIKRAFLQFGVLFFRDQKISFDDHARLAEYFGPCGQHVGVNTPSQTTNDPRVRKFHSDASTTRVAGNGWHTDQSCAPIPPMASILYLHTVPPDGGGDTAFASACAAYEGLSERMKIHLQGLTAYHDGRDNFGEGTPNAVHPLICRHPETGRKLIYISDGFTKRINDVSPEESDMLIRFLREHCRRPEWCMRFHWRPHSVAFWDNRCVRHRAIADYLPNVRSGYRVQIEGIAPPVAA